MVLETMVKKALTIVNFWVDRQSLDCTVEIIKKVRRKIATNTNISLLTIADDLLVGT